MSAFARSRAAVALMVGALLGTAVLTAYDATPAHASTTTMSGVNSGGSMTSVRSFASWRGRSVTVVNNYLPHDTWSDIANPGGGGPDDWKNSPLKISWAVPMLPNSGGTIQTGATGAYDTYFTSLAKKLVADGQGSASIRLGWEMNGTWYSWSAVKDPTSYIAYWRQIVTSMRAVSGAHFQFLWMPNDEVGGVNLQDEYPGDAYVDELGMTVYDLASGPSPAESTWRWSILWNGVNDQWGLRWLTSFAQAHGKPLAFPEWGLSSTCDIGGAGDDPSFIQRMYDYFADNNVAYETYMDRNEGNCDVHALRSGQFPNAAALYQKLWSKGFVPYTEPVTTGTLATSSDIVRVSPNADRSAPYALNGADLEGTAYLFAAVTAPPTRSVAFYLDGASSPTHQESTAPFDYIGGSDEAAFPIELENLKVGTHTMRTVVKTGTTTTTYAATFTVGEPKPTATTGDAPTSSDVVRVSASSARSNPYALNGATLVGNVYVFAVPNPSSTKSVTFYLDGAAKPTHVEQYAPYDFVGGTTGAAQPYKSGQLSSGKHTLKVVVATATSTTTYTVSFTVA